MSETTQPPGGQIDLEKAPVTEIVSRAHPASPPDGQGVNERVGESNAAKR